MHDDTDRKQLAEAYRATTYIGTDDDGTEWRVRVDEPSPVDGPMAYITADNPGSQPKDDDANARRRTDLEADLRAADYELVEARSVADDGDWPVEHGFFVFDISRSDAIDFARRYGQNAILFVDAGGDVQLVFCRDVDDGPQGPPIPPRG